ncbi:carbon monoxide dehydrogenase accessory protein CooC [soil metagenome]
MRIAIAGKGGSGKTTIAGTLARLLARRGRKVIAVDGDTNPNLAQTLGIASGADEGLTTLPTDILVRREEPDADPASELAIPVEEVLERYGTVGPDGVRLLVMGRVEHAGRGCKCRAHSVARYVIGDLLAYADHEGEVVVDMEAGLEHLSRGTTKYVDGLLAVAEPYYRSLETARRVYELAAELGIDNVRLLANKVRDEPEADAIRDYTERHGLEVAGEVPYDETIMNADLRGQPLLDADPRAPAVEALERLAVAVIAGTL